MVRRYLSKATAAGALLLAGSAGAALAQNSYPADEAALYEAAKAEGTVVWYTSAPLEPSIAVALEFEKKYPGIKVEALRLVGVQQFQRFMEEVQANQHNVDVLNLSDQPSMQTLIAENHVADWRVPTHERIPDAFRMGERAYAPYQTNLAIVYNVNGVTQEEIDILGKDWKGVLDPRFKGRFALNTMKCGTCYAAVHMFLDPKLQQEFGEAFIQQVADQKPAIFGESLAALDRVIAGEYDFTYWHFEAIAHTKWQQGAPIRWVYPKPTPSFGNAWQAVSSYAPHPNAARLFQNWVTSEEGASAIQLQYGSSTVLKEFADARSVSKEPWYKPLEEPYYVDFDRWGQNYHRDMEIWTNIINSSR